MSKIFYIINLISLLFAPWYISIVITTFGMLFIKNYKYIILLSFSIIEIGITGYFSVYNFSLFLFLLLIIYDLFKLGKKIRITNIPTILIALLLLLIISFVNFVFFFPIHFDSFYNNILNASLAIFKILFIIFLYLYLNNKTQDLIWLPREIRKYSTYFFIVVLVYFILESTTFSMYSRHVISGMDPNDFSARLVIFLFFTIIPFEDKTKLSGNNLNLTSIFNMLIVLYLVFLSGSRTALITYIIGLILFISFENFSIKFKVFFSLIFTFILYIFMFHTNYGEMILLRTFNSTNFDFSYGRISIWKNILRQTINNRPVLGYGLGKYVSSYLNYMQGGTLSFDHNIIVGSIAMFGLFGSIIYLIFISIPFQGLLSSKNKNNLVFFIPTILAVFSGFFLVWAFEETLLIYLLLSIFVYNHRRIYVRDEII